MKKLFKKVLRSLINAWKESSRMMYKDAEYRICM